MKPRTNFIYPKLNEKNRQYAGSILQSPVLRDDGNWLAFIPPYEQQRQKGIESSACYVEAQQHAIACIEEESLGETDNNYSARFNALLSGGTRMGGDPVAGADSIRHDGLIPDNMMNFKGLASWDEYHSFKGIDKGQAIKTGKAYLNKKQLNFGVVIEREYDLETKYTILREALKRSPVPMSVYGVTDSTKSYMPKPKGVRDTHMVLALGVDDQNRIAILDTYEPFIKLLPANYNMDFGVCWTVVHGQTLRSRGFLARIWSWINSFIAPIIDRDMEHARNDI